MELTEAEKESFENQKLECENKISEHQKLKEEYMESGEYQKAKKENEQIEKLKIKIQQIETKKLEKVQKKEIKKLNNNYDDIMKETKNKYESKIKKAEESYKKGLKEINDKYKKDLKEIEKKYILKEKHSPEYTAMKEEEKKLLATNRFDEAIALQKLRKKKEEEDNARYLMLHKAEIETLKKNATNKYNKEVTNYKNNKTNEIELIRNEMNIALDNIDKQFNNRRHDLISLQNNKSLIKTNVPLAKSRQVYRKSSAKIERSNIERIVGPMSLNNFSDKKIPMKKIASKGKVKSAKKK